MDSEIPQPHKRLDSTTRKSFDFYPQVGSCSIGKACATCEQQSRTLENQRSNSQLQYGKASSLRMAKEDSKKLLHDAKTDLTYLREVVAQHGKRIKTMWEGITQVQRGSWLSSKCEQVPETRSDLLEASLNGHIWAKLSPKVKDAILMPWLSIESLVDDPKKFLALIHARTHFEPEAWVPFNKDQTAFAWQHGLLFDHYANYCIVLSGPRFGEIVPWTDEAHRWITCPYPRGMLILVAQSLIARFLRQAIENLLQSPSSLTSSPNPRVDHTKIMTDLITHREVSWSLYINQGLSDPRFDVDRMLQIVQSRFSQAHDELWLLQTDAAYLQYDIKECSKGVLYNNALLQNGNADKYIFLRLTVWTELFRKASVWRDILDEVKLFKETYDKYGTSLIPGEALPVELDRSLAFLELFLSKMIRGQVYRIGKSLPELEAFESCYIFDTSVPRAIQITLKEESRTAIFNKDQLFWAILTICHHESESIDMWGPATIFGFLWSLLESAPPENKSRVEQRLRDDLSSLANMQEMLASVRHFRPGAPIPLPEAYKLCSSRPAWRRKFESEKDTRETPIPILEDLRADIVGLENAPFPTGELSSSWLVEANKVRGFSKDLWSKARELIAWDFRGPHCRKYTKQEKNKDLRMLSFVRFPQHLEELKSERETVLNMARKGAVEKGRQNAPQLETSLTTGRFEVTLDFGIPAVNIFKGTAAQSVELGSKYLSLVTSTNIQNSPRQIPQGFEHGEERQPGRHSAPLVRELLANSTQNTSRLPGRNEKIQENTVSDKLTYPPMPTVYVKRKNVVVLQRLFPQGGVERQASALEWETFVQAFADARFIIATVDGSEVAFTSPGSDTLLSTDRMESPRSSVKFNCRV
ncbi:hypothetical protein VTL71DRAFT_15606 [Oculimacula yallundae]|uniref:Uncharacterized protein n=1 Tax=Oculimacula yallundae TaxID=86028 RepID=A0ABR4CH94_9HELO